MAHAFKPWIGVALDGCLARNVPWGPEGTRIGDVVPAMGRRVRSWLAEGQEVRILSTRPARAPVLAAIAEWSERHLGMQLPITSSVDPGLTQLWSARVVQTELNCGRRMDGLDPTCVDCGKTLARAASCRRHCEGCLRWNLTRIEQGAR